MKKYLIPLGIVVTLIFMTLVTQKALASPNNNPMFPTFEEVQQMIDESVLSLQTTINNLGGRLSLVETAVTSNSQEIQYLNNRVTNIEDNMPMPQPTPPFNFNIYLNEGGISISGQDVNLRFPISTVQQKQIPGANWHEPLPRVQVWGVLHTPDGDVSSGVRFEAVGSQAEYCSLFFKMPNSYPGTSAIVDIYAFYGGKVTSSSFSINL